MFKGFIFGLEGTVYRGDTLIPGADEVVQLLRQDGRRVVFFSNKLRQTPEDYAFKLTSLGIPTQPDEVIVGESSSLMLQAVLEVMGLKAEDCVLIGDCLETEIKMGKESTVATGIVLTGVTDEKTLKESKSSSIQPDFIFLSIVDVQNLLIR